MVSACAIHEPAVYSQSACKILILAVVARRTGLPLPMGGNGANWVPRLLARYPIGFESIRHSLPNERAQYAMQFARDMDTALADRFVAMWVNDLTLDYTDRGREAVHRILAEGFERGIIPHRPTVEFAV